ncbi:MAG: ABC transporter permease subunit [Candidatus Paceibacterota bacterium]
MKKFLKYTILIFAVIAIWQYFGTTNSIVRLYISSPSLIIDYFSVNYLRLLEATMITFAEAFLGLIFATLLSFTIMVICFYRPKFLEFILPIMVTSQVIPIIVLAPFFIILFGIGLTSKIVMAMVISFFPIFVNFVQGYKAIPKNIHEIMFIYKAPTSFKIKNVYFPLAMPSIMAGLKISATLSVIGAIVAEFTGAKLGIGKNLFVSSIRLDPDLMMTSLILASFIGLVIYGIIRLVEKQYGSWYQ